MAVAKSQKTPRLWCHMTADTKDELHAFAAKIGRKRCWFHKGNHYDLTEKFRSIAVSMGAKEVTPIEMSRLARAIA